MAIWTLTRKELRLLLRDRISALLLVGMPLLFILLLGLLLGEGFGQKPDDSLRVSVVDLDAGLPAYQDMVGHAGGAGAASGWEASGAPDPTGFPGIAEDERHWSRLLQRDLRETSQIRVELVPSEEEGRRLTKQGKRAAVVVVGRNFSSRMRQCSFLEDGLNPFHRDGVYLETLDVQVLTDPNQPIGSSVINQVVQVSLMRVTLPYMIGAAFEKLSSQSFLDLLLDSVPGAKLLLPESVRKALGPGIQKALRRLFPKYNLRAKTWASLTRPEAAPGPEDDPQRPPADLSVYENRSGVGPISRGAVRYQILVPSYTVMFAFGLILTLGWLFVLERRQGTLPRLHTAPITRTQILLGKMLPCYLISVAQGVFLLLAGKLIFGMSWGPPDWPLWRQILMLMPVVACTSLAAMGLAMLVATVARTEIQVALLGSMLVLLLGLISGCLLPAEMMPEAMREVSHWTPHAWALDAYRELLRPAESGAWQPDLNVIAQACGVLAAFGVGASALAWVAMLFE